MANHVSNKTARERLDRWVLIGVVLAVAAALAYVGYRLFFPPPPPNYAALAAQDLATMWETMDTPSGRASTPQATNAAHRYFRMHSLIGKTREQILALVGDPNTASDSAYKAPHFPVGPEVLVYRYDTGSRGAAGWQFDVSFGADGRATGVLERAIQR